MLEILVGYLKQLPDGSFVVRKSDLTKIKPIFIDVPIHPSMNNNILLKHGKEVEFVIETIAMGTNEFDVMDCDVAVLVPDNNEYDEVYPYYSGKMLNSIFEKYPEEQLLKADGLDDAIIGVEDKTMRLIYSKRKCIEIFVNEGMTEEDALEHYYYNVAGSYVGEKTPIWCEDTLV